MEIVGSRVGSSEGFLVGRSVGSSEGFGVGGSVGLADGDGVGRSVGLVVGNSVGNSVGGSVKGWHIVYAKQLCPDGHSSADPFWHGIVHLSLASS